MYDTQKASDPLLTPIEVSQRTKAAVQTLARWRIKGRHLSFVKIGSRVYYRSSVVERFLANQERASTSDRGTSQLSGSPAGERSSSAHAA
jgi:hypothetical protein